MIEEIQAFAWGEEIEDRADPVPERWDRAFCGLSQVCFEFCEGHLDGVEVGRVRRQIAQLRPGGRNAMSSYWRMKRSAKLRAQEKAAAEKRSKVLS